MFAGSMQSWPLTVPSLLEHGARWHGEREIVSRRGDGTFARVTYAELRRRALRLSRALLRHGIEPGDRVASLAMNSADHICVSYGVSGSGAVFHTLNPRLPLGQLAWIIRHAEDRMIFADGEMAELLGRLSREEGVELPVVYLSRPVGDGPAGVTIEDFVKDVADSESWAALDENAPAGLCYTSGTTGDPKGVLYTHRSNVLHTLIVLQPDIFGLSVRDVILPIVPMYHANGWGLTYAAPAVGAKLVMPGSALDGASLAALMAQEKVTFAAGVPTVWAGVLEHLRAHDLRLPHLRLAVVGGAALSPRLLRLFDELQIPMIHAWGMTELSPVGGACVMTPETDDLPADARAALRLKQGRVPYGIDMRIVGEDKRPLPHDGMAVGSLQMRGPAVVRRYFRHEADSLDEDGFFETGDVATIDRHGFMQIVDRAKDIIKSGGEWISSIALENAALAHSAVAMAAAVGMSDAKWGERPLLFVVPAAGGTCDAAGLRQHLERQVPKWWLPDRIEIVDALPLGATGKVDKKALRAKLAALTVASDQ